MRKITIFIPITIPDKYSANVTPSIKVLKTLNIEPIYPERLSNESLTALHSGGDEPIDLGIYNTNHDYGCLIQKLQEISKLIHAVHILDLTHDLTLPQFISHSQSIVDPPLHYTLENTVRGAKEFEQELKCTLSCKVTRTELPSGLDNSEIECLIRENQKSLLDEIVRIWEFYSETVIMSEHIHVDTVSTNRNLQYIPQRFRSLEILLNAVCPDVEFYEVMKLKQEAKIIESIKSYSNQHVYAISFNTLKEFLEKKGILQWHNDSLS